MLGNRTHAQRTLNIRQQAEESAETLPALMVKAERAVHSLLHGEHNRRRAGHGLQFWQFREYSPLDRPQDIDWRQSAKADRIFIRQKELQTPQTTLFWSAGGPGMAFSSHNRYPAKEQAAHVLTMALALLITRAGDQVGMLGTRRSGRSEAALEKLGHGLLDKDRDALPDIASITMPSNASLVLTGDFLSPIEEIERFCRDLSEIAAHVVLVQVLDPAELNLPYSGRVVFEDPAHAYRQRVENAASLRSAYKQRIDSHIDGLRHICQSHGWHYTLHATDTAYRDTLATIWATLAAHHNLEAR